VNLDSRQLIALLRALYQDEAVAEEAIHTDWVAQDTPYWKISDKAKRAFAEGRTIVIESLTVTVEEVSGASAKFAFEYRDKENSSILVLQHLPWINKGNTLTIMPLSEALTIKVS